MGDIAGYPYFEVEFTKQGTLHDENQVTQMLDFLSAGTVTDLVLMSHGWNNDMEEARALYRNFFAAMHRVMDAAPGVAWRPGSWQSLVSYGLRKSLLRRS